MKLVIADHTLITRNALKLRFDEVFDECKVYPFTAKDELLERIHDADAVFVNRVAISREIMEQCEKLKYIGVFATGYNLIDIEGAKELGITVCNVPEYSSNAVAQHTFALILEITNQISELNKTVKSGNWNDESIIKIPLSELYGKTLGLIGYGNIAKAVERIAESFGMNVIHCKNTKTEDSVTLEELCRSSDIISLHCPSNDSTRNMINRDTIALMKDGAVLINTARGNIIDDKAVAEALDSGKLYMAGIDVMSKEPPAADNPLLNHPRCIITPHVAWAPEETRKRLIDIVFENYMAFLDGKPQNVVNK